MRRARAAQAASVAIPVALNPAASLADAAAASAPQVTQAVALAGEWAPDAPCASSRNRLRFAGNALAFFSGEQRLAEYEVTLTQEGDRVTVRVVRVIHGPGSLPPGGAIQYRRDGEDLRLVGVALRGDAFAGPTVATLYCRCE